MGVGWESYCTTNQISRCAANDKERGGLRARRWNGIVLELCRVRGWSGKGRFSKKMPMTSRPNDPMTHSPICILNYFPSFSRSSFCLVNGVSFSARALVKYSMAFPLSPLARYQSPMLS